jgi:AraC family transcriptional regulator, activator of mtrCDE
MRPSCETSFSEGLVAARMSLAARLLVERRSIPVAEVRRLVGYRSATRFTRAFRRRYGLPPALFRERARSGRAAQRRSIA